MKYHKIPNIELTICTAEQKIAYNLAFSLHINSQTEFDRVNAECPGTARNSCAGLAQQALKHYRMGYNYKPGRYDEDSIFCALNAGLYDYLCKPFIAVDYETIGKAFPAQYLSK